MEIVNTKVSGVDGRTYYSLQKRRIPRRKEVEEWRTRVMGYEEVR